VLDIEEDRGCRGRRIEDPCRLVSSGRRRRHTSSLRALREFRDLTTTVVCLKEAAMLQS
jgi:hypothetical protein